MNHIPQNPENGSPVLQEPFVTYGHLFHPLPNRFNEIFLVPIGQGNHPLQHLPPHLQGRVIQMVPSQHLPEHLQGRVIWITPLLDQEMVNDLNAHIDQGNRSLNEPRNSEKPFSPYLQNILSQALESYPISTYHTFLNIVRHVYSKVEDIPVITISCIYCLAVSLLLYHSNIRMRPLIGSLFLIPIIFSKQFESFSEKIHQSVKSILNRISEYNANLGKKAETAKTMYTFFEMIGKMAHLISIPLMTLAVAERGALVLEKNFLNFPPYVCPLSRRNWILFLLISMLLCFRDFKNIYQSYKEQKTLISMKHLEEIEPEPLDPELECSITQEQIKLLGRVSGCKHSFELTSIIQHLHTKATCPCCRAEVFEDKNKNHLEFISKQQYLEEKRA